MINRTDKYVSKSRPLILSYWLMPLATGLAVTIVAAGILIEAVVLANKIDSNVTGIVPATASIQVHAANIAQLNQVDATAKSIKSAADPLSGQADTILNTVNTIRSTGGSIDNVTGSINSHASAISATVDSIAPHVRLIAEPVERIGAKLTTTLSDLDTILSIVAGARADLDNVLSQPVLPTINDHARSIDCKLGGVCANP